MNTQIENLLTAAQQKVKVKFPNDSSELQQRKVINLMKEKRNSKKGSIKSEYQAVIDRLENQLNNTKQEQL